MKRIEYIITQEDVNRNGVVGGFKPLGVETCACCGHVETVSVDFAPLGRVMQCDVGKKMVRINGRWHVENVPQFEARTKGMTTVTIIQ
jgi:hypothetical protein